MGAIAEAAIFMYEIVATSVLPALEAIIVSIAEALWSAMTWLAEGLVWIGEELWAGLSEFGSLLAEGYEAARELVIEFMYQYTDPIVLEVYDFIGDLTQPLWDVMEILHIREILRVHLILSTILPSYRELVARLLGNAAQFVSALAAGAMQVAAYMEFTHATFILGGAIVGQPFAVSEIRWIRETSKWMEETGKDFEHYVDAPGDLVAAINVSIIEPLANQIGENQTALYQRLTDLHVGITQVDERLTNVSDALDTWQQTAPAAWRSEIAGVAGQIRDGIDEWRATVYLPDLLKIGADIKKLDAQRAALDARIDRPGLLFEKTLRKGAPQQNRQLTAMDHVVAAALRRTQERLRERS